MTILVTGAAAVTVHPGPTESVGGAEGLVEYLSPARDAWILALWQEQERDGRTESDGEQP